MYSIISFYKTQEKNKKNLFPFQEKYDTLKDSDAVIIRHFENGEKSQNQKNRKETKTMKKALVMLLVGAVAVMTVAGCSSSEETEESAVDTSSSEEETDTSDIMTAEEILALTDYDVTEYVTLMEGYDSLTVELTTDYSVTDDDVQSYIESYVLAYYPDFVEMEDDTVVDDGDYVNIDYVGYLDGEEFDGGTGSDYTLEIGSGDFVDGFEDALLEAEVGETVTFDITFDEDYSSETVAGQTVTFEVTINSIMEAVTLEYDEMTDDYVYANFGTSGITTVDELIEDVTSQLESTYEYYKNSEVQSLILYLLEEGCEVTLPDGLVESKAAVAISQVEADAELYDMEYEDFVSTYYGYDDMDEFYEYVESYVETQQPQLLILEAVIADMGISISLSDYQEYAEYYAEYYGYDDVDEFVEDYGGEDALILNYAESSALAELAELATVIDYVEEETEEDLSE